MADQDQFRDLALTFATEVVGRIGRPVQYEVEVVTEIVRLAIAHGLEMGADISDELEQHYSAYKNTALLNGDVALSNAASGEPRAARFIAEALRAKAKEISR